MQKGRQRKAIGSCAEVLAKAVRHGLQHNRRCYGLYHFSSAASRACSTGLVQPTRRVYMLERKWPELLSSRAVRTLANVGVLSPPGRRPIAQVVNVPQGAHISCEGLLGDVIRPTKQRAELWGLRNGRARGNNCRKASTAFRGKAGASLLCLREYLARSEGPKGHTQGTISCIQAHLSVLTCPVRLPILCEAKRSARLPLRQPTERTWAVSAPVAIFLHVLGRYCILLPLSLHPGQDLDFQLIVLLVSLLGSSLDTGDSFLAARVYTSMLVFWACRLAAPGRATTPQAAL